MRAFQCAAIQITIRLEYLALDEVRRTHRVAMVLAGIPRSNTIRRLKRRAILSYCFQLQSLETCPRRDRALDAVFHIIRLMNNGGAALGAIRRVGVNSLGVAAIGRIKHLRTRL